MTEGALDSASFFRYNDRTGGGKSVFYKENDVFTEALERIRMLFDAHDDIIVSMSGGKDSTVLFNLALMVAREKKRLPLKVFWLDQEAEWQHTVDYMDSVMRMPEVEPYWFQIPFDFTNSLSPKSNFLRVFDEVKPSEWVHPKSDISIKENPTKYQRYHDLVKHLPAAITNKTCAVLVGMRMSESPRRRMSITGRQEQARRADTIAGGLRGHTSPCCPRSLMLDRLKIISATVCAGKSQSAAT